MVIGTPVQRAISPAGRGSTFQLYYPSGTGFRLPAKMGRLCGAQQGGAGYGAAPANLMPNSALRVWAASVGNAAGRKGTDIIR